MLKCTSCPCRSLSLFLRALSLWCKALVIRCPWFFVCSFVQVYKGWLSPSTSLFFLLLFSSPFTLLNSPPTLFHMSYSSFLTYGSLFSLLSFCDGEYLQHFPLYTCTFWQSAGYPVQFLLQATGGQWWSLCQSQWSVSLNPVVYEALDQAS